jgi:hypothetical protein
MNPWDQPGFGLDVDSSTAAKDDAPPIRAQFLPVRNHGLHAISSLESQQGLLPPQTRPRKSIAIERRPPATATPGRLDGEDGPLPCVESLNPTQASWVQTMRLGSRQPSTISLGPPLVQVLGLAD